MVFGKLIDPSYPLCQTYHYYTESCSDAVFADAVGWGMVIGGMIIVVMIIKAWKNKKPRSQ